MIRLWFWPDYYVFSPNMSCSYPIVISYVVKPILLLSENMENNVIIDQSIGGHKEDMELPIFDLATIAKATNNFSSNNKLGEGDFGPVYKVTYNILV